MKKTFSNIFFFFFCLAFPLLLLLLPRLHSSPAQISLTPTQPDISSIVSPHRSHPPSSPRFIFFLLLYPQSTRFSSPAPQVTWNAKGSWGGSCHIISLRHHGNPCHSTHTRSHESRAQSGAVGCKKTFCRKAEIPLAFFFINPPSLISPVFPTRFRLFPSPLIIDHTTLTPRSSHPHSLAPGSLITSITTQLDLGPRPPPRHHHRRSSREQPP